eukprot:6176343-Pleurochrysis_carterae.AAC.3
MERDIDSRMYRAVRTTLHQWEITEAMQRAAQKNETRGLSNAMEMYQQLPGVRNDVLAGHVGDAPYAGRAKSSILAT